MAKVYQIRITLQGSKPPIWRQMLVPSDLPLGDLHDFIQIAMGWTDSHLHQFILRNAEPRAAMFRAHPRVFAPQHSPFGDDLDLDGEDEDAVTLAKVCPRVKSKIIYEYDFGDGWQHVIEVQKILDADDPTVDTVPFCLKGKGACPPEDCGGIFGYYGLLKILADPKHPEHEEISDWLDTDHFDPDAFDVDEVNAILCELYENE